ncbi:hypothetical protein G647_10116 [Cladophialophora carrionii CBS 160.54]|uniref:Major facilitator superfamily (MFS) profile domain-containing protein n=1 Tax=Cladophialophora carrionii CBS 160.54 TaxID=1279043 RepID=V9DM32_9EURO|nr:uncharacterized protein G647_10116 [Cladophialophora carrionii CBS 160.54]ETI27017.1 hypothetical protein G647_10116 [Cladophialophora carrionii CBS 160.54]
MTSADNIEGGTAVRVDETTALLAPSPKQPASRENGGESQTSSGGTDTAEDKPLPRDQILYLCFARFVEPVAFFCIFPFVNQMIWETGEVAETDVGFYSGLIESLFSLTQMCLMILWGKAADHFGRKPVLVSSLAGVAVATATFGLSRTIWQMIVFRCFAGIFAGTVLTIRTMITENSTPQTQARAFSFFAFTGNLGIFLGPAIGGALAKPATVYPSVFGKIKFFWDYPYALPTFVTGAIGAIATITSAFGLKEASLSRSGNATGSGPPKKMSMLELLRSPNVTITLFIYAYIMILAFSYTAIVPVFFFTPVHLGGYGFSPLLISIFMGLGGLSQSLWLLIAFPWLQARFGTKWVMKLCALTYPFFFVFYPMCNMLLRWHMTAAFWAIAPVASVVGSGVAMSFTGIQLVLNDVSPGPEVLGTLNAVALTLVSGLRAFSPALFASLFATSVRSGVLGGHVIWILMVCLAVGFSFLSQWVPEPIQAESKSGPRMENGRTEEGNEQ